MKQRKPRYQRIAKYALKHHPVSDGDIIAIKNNGPLANKQAVSALSSALSENGYDGVMIVFVDNPDDLSILSEEEMNEHGWYRKE